MTDKDIIKALECCTTNGASCKDCPAFVKVERSNCNKYFRGALALINRQQAEIERLQTEKDNLIKTYKECATELLKEFAERLKNKKARYNADYFYVIDYIPLKEIDNLVKEMVGEG